MASEIMNELNSAPWQLGLLTDERSAAHLERHGVSLESARRETGLLRSDRTREVAAGTRFWNP